MSKPVVYRPTGDVIARSYRNLTAGGFDVTVSYEETADAFVVSAVVSSPVWSRGVRGRVSQWRSVEWLVGVGVNSEQLADVLSRPQESPATAGAEKDGAQ